MSDLYVDIEGAADIRDLDLSKPIVDATTDLDTLHGWYDTLVNKSTEIAEFLQAYRLAEIDDEDYFRRTAGKLAYVRIALKWVERRILSLGAMVNYPPNDPRQKQLTILEEKLKKMTAKVAALEQAA